MKTRLVALVLLALFPALLGAGELHVGQKVVYPGGVDQPPKEKDVGTSLKVDNISVAGSEGGVPLPEGEEDDLAALLDSGQTRELIETTRTRKDPTSRAFLALALMTADDPAEGLKLAKTLVTDPELSDELRDRLREKIAEAREDAGAEGRE